MTQPKTLLELSGVHSTADLHSSILVLIDYQNEYLDGKLPLFEVEKAIESTQRLLAIARRAGVPVIHVVHQGVPSGLFDRSARNGQIMEALCPLPTEAVIEKTFPNAFAGTCLHAKLQSYAERNHLIVAGLMTHMCLASTVSAAIDHGYGTTVVASTTTTRDLAGEQGTTVPATMVRAAALATLKDRFSTVIEAPDTLY